MTPSNVNIDGSNANNSLSGAFFNMPGTSNGAMSSYLSDSAQVQNTNNSRSNLHNQQVKGSHEGKSRHTQVNSEAPYIAHSIQSKLLGTSPNTAIPKKATSKTKPTSRMHSNLYP